MNGYSQTTFADLLEQLKRMQMQAEENAADNVRRDPDYYKPIPVEGTVK